MANAKTDTIALAEDSGRPKYEQLKSYLADQVATGKLLPGAALPSEQRLAESLQIARSTVRQAMALLERDGLIRRVHGKGTFVHEQARTRLRRGLDVFALVLPETQAGFYPSLQRSFDEAAGQMSHQMLVCNTGNDLDKQGNVILQLIDKEVAGVAIVPATAPPTPTYQIRQIQKRGIPVVFCHRSVEGIRAPLLAIPFEEAGRLAARAMLEQGHRRIAYLSPHRSAASLGYEAGLREELGKSAIDLEPCNVLYGSPDATDPAIQEREVFESLSRICSASDRPTAIFASFDSLAETIYLLLGRLGLSVPGDMSLVSFGGHWRNGAVVRRLTCVAVDEVAIGRRAVEILDAMRRSETPIEHEETHVMPVTLLAGETLGAAPKRTTKRKEK